MEQLNISLFTSINQLAGQHQLLDYIFIIAAEGMPYFFIALVIAAWFYSKQQAKRYLIGATLTSVVGISINHLIAQVYFHPRPFMDNLGTTLVEHSANSSFPSDHTTFMFCIAVSLLCHQTMRKLALRLTILALFGGLARVYIGVHFPFDIAAALVVSSFAVLLVHSARHKLASAYDMIINIGDQLTNLCLPNK